MDPISEYRIRLSAVALVVLMVGAAVAIGIGTGTVAAQDPNEVDIEDPGAEIIESGSTDLVISEIDPEEGIGAFEVNITYNENIDSIDVSDTDRFDVESEVRETDAGGETTVTIVGFTSETDPSGDESLTLADIGVSSQNFDTTGEIEVDEVSTLVDPDGDDIVPINIGDGASFTISASDDLESIDLSVDAGTTLDEGDTSDVTVTANFADGTEADVTDSEDLELSSNDTSVLSVDDTAVTAESEGSALLTAEYLGEEDDVEITVEEDEDEDDDTATTGGGGAATPPADDDDDVEDDPVDEEPDVEDVTEIIDESEPDTDVERDIEDADPDTPGITVDTSDETQTVESITFADEETTGSVNVREYSDEAVVDETSNSLSAQLDQDIRTVGSVADITVADDEGEPAADTAATITMGIDADDVEDPDNVVINHETDDGWEQLETTVEEVTDDRVRVSGDVDGFSLFAVAETEPEEEPADDEEPDDVDEPVDDGIGATGLIGLVVVIALVIAAALGYRRMNNGGENNL